MWLGRHLQDKMGFEDLQGPWSSDSVGSVSHTQEKLESVDTWPCCLTIFSKVPLQLLF